MARIRYYTETLEDCTVIDRSPSFQIEHKLARGVWFGSGKGHRTKREALDYCNRINLAAGREVVRYYGALDESECGLTVRNLISGQTEN